MREPMGQKFDFMKPLFVGGAVAAAIAVMPVAAAEAYVGPTGTAAHSRCLQAGPGRRRL